MITKDATFSLVVNYDRSYKDGIAAGNFRVVNLHLNDDLGYGECVENHYPTGSGKKEVFFRYFHFDLGRYIKEEEVIAEMKKEGYRPAVLDELLAAVEQRPELQGLRGEHALKTSLVALGTDWAVVHCAYCDLMSSCHHHKVATFWVNSRGERGIGTFLDRGQRWETEKYFLAVRKEERGEAMNCETFRTKVRRLFQGSSHAGRRPRNSGASSYL